MESPNQALLIVDMINTFKFPGGTELARASLPAAERIATLARRFRQQKRPVVYANDHFANWQADFRDLVAICGEASAPGAGIVRLLTPQQGDYYVLKPKHSAFLASALPVLLDELKVQRLVITGIATDACVLATALDANARGFEVHVPADCVAARSPMRTRRTLALLQMSFGASVTHSRSVLAAGARRREGDKA
jgi:nicotinamidase-related amidase